MRILFITLIQITGLLVLSCGKENDKATQQVVASPQGAVTPPIGQNPQPTPDQKDFPYSSRVYATSADLPACTESLKGALAYVLVTKTFQTCDATTWVTIEVADKPSENGAGLGVYDTNGDKLGNLTGPVVVEIGNGEPYFTLILLDGLSFSFFPSELGNFIQTGTLPRSACYYASDDCTGECFGNSTYPANSSVILYDYSSNSVRQLAGWNNYQTFISKSHGYGGQTPVCYATPTNTNPYNHQKTKPYSPTQFKYPFALPLSVR